jgi:hypothetical protein
MARMGRTVLRVTESILLSVTTDANPLPGTLRTAVWLVRGESAALGLLGAFLVYEALTVTATDLTTALLLAAFTIGAAVGLWALTGALWRRHARARAPVIVLQLLLLPVGYYMVQGGLGWLGVPLVALGVLVSGLLVSPTATKAFGLG